MAPPVQASFTLRTSPNVKTVHLLGTWDNYARELPLSADKSKKAGAWKGTFRFSGSVLEPGQRYWYYYIVDGYHVSHDPAKEYTTEPTTGRKMNILNMPGGKKSSKPTTSSAAAHRRQSSQDVPTGRALSPGKIQHPRPSKPYASRQLREADYSRSPTDELSERFASARIADYRYSPPSSVGSDTSFSDGGDSHHPSSPDSLSSLSDGSCSCGRYLRLSSGELVKADCGGKRCGYQDSSSNCSSSQSESSEDESDRRRREKRYREVAYKEVSYSKAGGRRR